MRSQLPGAVTSDEAVLWFEEIGLTDLGRVGGKNANLGEMFCHLTRQGIKVPPGFAISADVFREFIAINQLQGSIDRHLDQLARGEISLAKAGAGIRDRIAKGEFTTQQITCISKAYKQLGQRVGCRDISVAVRSSATAEDLPTASFAGQQESYLNIRGASELLEATRQCFASLYTDRAIAYREEQGFAHEKVALSVGVQQMIEAESAGVMFTLDTETGFPDVVLITAAWGLGETVVKGSVIPDRYMVYKPFLKNSALRPLIEKELGSKRHKMVYSDNTSAASGPTLTVDTSVAQRQSHTLSDDEVILLSRWGAAIEQHYAVAMDIEWVKEQQSEQFYIVQARPETIESQRDGAVLTNYQLKQTAEVLAQGASVGSAIAVGRVCHINDPGQMEQFPQGGILVAQRTDPDWVPVMRKAAGIITDSGGPTSHAAIVSRELKVPAIVGTGNATQVLSPNIDVTLSCAEGATGKVFAGALDFETRDIHLDEIPHTKTDIMINTAMPDGAMHWWQLPVAGIGLARLEFIISSRIKVHPMALLHPEKVLDTATLNRIQQLTAAYREPADYFVEVLSRDIAKIAASRYPDPVVVRMSDFKSNEYRGLIGGDYFEIEEENPMLGLRGASRYYHPLYREAFQLECLAVKYAREKMGFDNIIVMIPFCRTPDEADKVLATMAEMGLERGNGLKVYVMCEIPSNIIRAEEFAARFDGFSIGSNDLTQLILGIDRDSAELKSMFDARDKAVKHMIAEVISSAHKHACKVGICGQAPSDHPDFAEFLVGCGIDSISLNPDSVVNASHHILAAEKERL